MTEQQAPPVPDAPWALVGECLIAVIGGGSSGRGGAGFPAGVRRLPGPVLVVAMRYTDSPVGPFLELAVAEPAHLGLRPGLCVTTSVVSASPARVGGRLGWGFPRELGRLTWWRDGDGASLRWDDRAIDVRAEPGRHAGRFRRLGSLAGLSGLRLPFLVPMRSLQRRTDGPVVVPGHVRGIARLAHVDLVVPDDDPLAWLAGRHRGLVVSGARVLLRPARRPTGLFSTFRAPLRAAEPALSIPGDGVQCAFTPAGRGRAPVTRALSSVG